MDILRTPAEVIDRLGGNAKLARRLGLDPRVVQNWRRLGFPANRYVMFQRLLAEIGCTAPKELWKQVTLRDDDESTSTNEVEK